MKHYLHESNDDKRIYVELSKEDVEKIIKEKFGESIINICCCSASFEVKLETKNTLGGFRTVP